MSAAAEPRAKDLPWRVSLGWALAGIVCRHLTVARSRRPSGVSNCANTAVVDGSPTRAHRRARPRPLMSRVSWRCQAPAIQWQEGATMLLDLGPTPRGAKFGGGQRGRGADRRTDWHASRARIRRRAGHKRVGAVDAAPLQRWRSCYPTVARVAAAACDRLRFRLGQPPWWMRVRHVSAVGDRSVGGCCEGRLRGTIWGDRWGLGGRGHRSF